MYLFVLLCYFGFQWLAKICFDLLLKKHKVHIITPTLIILNLQARELMWRFFLISKGNNKTKPPMI